MSALRPGILSYSQKGGGEKLVVSGGFVEVNGDRVAVLVDSAESPSEIDVDSARALRDETEKTAAGVGLVSDDEAAATREKLDHAAARLQLASGR